ncbi:MAG: bifunctional DNA-formamidopyrimidine glycosylase/DNA-(apurinic or apyrimidinic site) lyase [Gammaproteobacteria bacterium]|nr:MAG: bifunctional DNA-formamidopyrimidine glycosylase/DNA-(apurinic or apyrimidinic site) lyase [Gammaproteobacteria bacterium]
MPELPEVIVTLQGVSPHILGKKVVSVAVREPRLRWPVPDTLQISLCGLQLLECVQRGKYMLFRFATGHLMIHLGMSGNLRIVNDATSVGKHDHVDITFADGTVLRYTDPRRFGTIQWLDIPPQQHPLLSQLGPEPFGEDFSGDYLYQRSRGRKVPVKQFLMDSKVVVGVGNIYANESLFHSGLRPTVAAGKISRVRYVTLAEQVREVLSRAIAQGGTTLRDFVGGDGKPGYFKQQLYVYGRGGEPCVHCGTVLKEIRQGQRTTVYCPSCQR